MKKLICFVSAFLIALSANAASHKKEKLPKNNYVENAYKTNKQIMLKVRIGEVSRVALNGLGDNILLTGRRDLSKKLDWLEAQGVFKNIAESNLVALDGEEAQMHIGGEMPIPVSKMGTLHSINYKQYGLNVRFIPKISGERLLIEVEPSLIEPRIEGAVKISGIAVPIMIKSHAKTKVNLASGETIMIAGLSKDSFAADSTRGIGFNSNTKKSYNKTISEIVIIVTPYIVHPSRENVIVPGDNFDEAAEIQKLLSGNKSMRIDSNPNKIGMAID